MSKVSKIIFLLCHDQSLAGFNYLFLCLSNSCSFYFFLCSYIQIKAAQGRIFVDVGRPFFFLFFFKFLPPWLFGTLNLSACGWLSSLNRFLGRSSARKCIQYICFGASSWGRSTWPEGSHIYYFLMETSANKGFTFMHCCNFFGCKKDMHLSLW